MKLNEISFTRKFLVLFLAVFIIASCGDGKESAQEGDLLEDINEGDSTKPEISQETLNAIIQQIPSPLEISVLLKESGHQYNKSTLNSSDNASNYNTNFEKALNLGIYGTDLGYTNIYEQNQDGIVYLSSIKELADELNIGQFFDFNTIKRLATNSNNLDSLLLITTKNFNDINSYLQEQRRANLSILLLTGGWLEALHIAEQVYKEKPESDALREKIGEQKIILENIMLLLSFYNDDPDIAKLETEMRKLADVYADIEIKYTYGESTFKEVDGVLTIVQETTSEIIMSDEQLEKIIEITSEIRKNIIS
ncbi:hypothetical protein [Marinigracilibium pacificum]|uniref:hypothetical protein n=1 Tax=Marinigracilibium pacificum TaxID=2729599 RepID=UPI00232A6F37|nr:hypothetical protein [Marinigracilibium pacificum]